MYITPFQHTIRNENIYQALIEIKSQWYLCFEPFTLIRTCTQVKTFIQNFQNFPSNILIYNKRVFGCSNLLFGNIYKLFKFQLRTFKKPIAPSNSYNWLSLVLRLEVGIGTFSLVSLSL